MSTTISPKGMTTAVVLPWSGTKSWLFQIGLIVLAVVLPAVAHMTGGPVRWMLPMHWPILLAGLLYGWRGGLTVGLLAPITNWALTGYPAPLVLPAMIVELATYGFVSGWLREQAGWKGIYSVVTAVICGRIVFITAILAGGSFTGQFGTYLFAAMLPGLPAGVLQVVTVPIVARWWLGKDGDNKRPL